MGTAISAVRKTLSKAEDDTAKLVKDNLRLCEENGKMIANNFRLQVTEAYKNPGEFDKWQVAGGRQDREDMFIGTSTESNPSSNIEDGVNSLVQGIFGVVKGDDSAGDKLIDAITKMVSGACSVFLGNSCAGSSTHTTFLIIPHGFAFYRVDICMYKYTFTSEGITKYYESQTVVYASRGILSLKNLTNNELLSYVSEMNGGAKAPMLQWMQNFTELYKAAQDMIDNTANTPAKDDVLRLLPSPELQMTTPPAQAPSKKRRRRQY